MNGRGGSALAPPRFVSTTFVLNELKAKIIFKVYPLNAVMRSSERGELT